MTPRHYFQLSTAAAVATIALKTLAWWLTGSLGLASDALESFVNLAGASFALWMITIAHLPADEDHPFGHTKAEYFSSGFEGLPILGAALAILWAAAGRLATPEPLESIGLGLAVSVAASAINLGVALAMRRAAVRHRSISLEGGARHLMADVWTSVGVITGIALVALTGWLQLDALVAMAVGLHILREGWQLVRASAHGLMDSALSAADQALIERTLSTLATGELRFANLRTRRAGSRQFAYVDVRVPPGWTVQQAHDECDRIEQAVAAALPGTVVFTHPEPAAPEAPAGPAVNAR